MENKINVENLKILSVELFETSYNEDQMYRLLERVDHPDLERLLEEKIIIRNRDSMFIDFIVLDLERLSNYSDKVWTIQELYKDRDFNDEDTKIINKCWESKTCILIDEVGDLKDSRLEDMDGYLLDYIMVNPKHFGCKSEFIDYVHMMVY